MHNSCNVNVCMSVCIRIHVKRVIKPSVHVYNVKLMKNN